MNDEGIDRIEVTLTSILRLLAAEAVEGKSLAEGVQLLDRAGLESGLIADICGTTAGTVRATLSRAKRSGHPKRR